MDADAELDLVAQTSVAFLTNGGNNPIEISTLGIDSDILFRSLSTSADLIIDSAATLTYSAQVTANLISMVSRASTCNMERTWCSPAPMIKPMLEARLRTSVTTTTFISTDDVFVNSLGDVLISKLNFLADTGSHWTLDATTTEFDISEGDFNSTFMLGKISRCYLLRDPLSLRILTPLVESISLRTVEILTARMVWRLRAHKHKAISLFFTAAGIIEAIAPNGDITIASAAANTLTAQDCINVERQGHLGVSIVSGSVDAGYTATASTMSTTAERSIQLIAQQTDIVLTAAAGGSIDMAPLRDFEMSSTGTFEIWSHLRRLIQWSLPTDLSRSISRVGVLPTHCHCFLPIKPSKFVSEMVWYGRRVQNFKNNPYGSHLLTGLGVPKVIQLRWGGWLGCVIMMRRLPR